MTAATHAFSLCPSHVVRAHMLPVCVVSAFVHLAHHRPVIITPFSFLASPVLLLNPTLSTYLYVYVRS